VTSEARSLFAVSVLLCRFTNLDLLKSDELPISAQPTLVTLLNSHC